MDARTGGKLAELTVPTDPGGYGGLLTWADATRVGPRTWALEGGGGYGAGPTRFPGSVGERVVELDRPKRAARRHGAKSDSLDAVRAAREALGREHLAAVKADGPRAELAAPMTARRSALEAATLAWRRLHALVVAAPEELRALLRGTTTTVMIQTGIGVVAAAQVLICWSHPGRIRSEAAFAMLAPRARPTARSAAASGATSPATCSANSNTAHGRLDEP
ncbi:hypothetical protein [Cellulomonas hominis]